MAKIDPNDPTQTLIAGYLPADPPAGMLPRAAARYRALSAQERYKAYVVATHVSPSDAIKIARGHGLVGDFKIEHQVAKDIRSAPVIEQRWTVDAGGVVTLALI